MTAVKRKTKKSYATRFETTDLLTGEVVGTPVYVARKKKFSKKDWHMTFADGLRRLSLDRDITGEIRRVLDQLMIRMSYENYIIVSQKEIAEELKICKTNVSRAVATLVRKGYVEKGPRIKNVYPYRLSLDLGWKGSANSFENAKKDVAKKTSKELVKERWRVAHDAIVR